MAYSLSSERPRLAAVIPNPFRSVARWLKARRLARARRVALSNLLDFDAALLDDIGVSRRDVIEALQYPSHGAGLRLAARRAEASRDWLAHR